MRGARSRPRSGPMEERLELLKEMAENLAWPALGLLEPQAEPLARETVDLEVNRVILLL